MLKSRQLGLTIEVSVLLLLIMLVRLQLLHPIWQKGYLLLHYLSQRNLYLGLHQFSTSDLFVIVRNTLHKVPDYVTKDTILRR